MGWCPAAKAADIPAGQGKAVEAEGRRIALFNVGGTFHALADSCPHRGGPLGDGYLDGKNVTCPWHAWEFDVTTGECLTMPDTKQTCFKTKVENGEVWVDL